MLEKQELLNVVGGINITGTLISSVSRYVNAFMNLGRSFGSAIRRAIGGSMCPI